MTAEGWEPHWLQDHAGRITEPQAWRGVESQYASSTTLLVDSLDEHDELERLLEGSKPPLPEAADPRKHFLLAELGGTEEARAEVADTVMAALDGLWADYARRQDAATP